MRRENRIPIENFMRYPKRGFKLSPDGENVIYKDTFNKVTSIFVKNILIGSNSKIEIPEDYTKYAEEVYWGNNDKVLMLSINMVMKIFIYLLLIWMEHSSEI